MTVPRKETVRLPRERTGPTPLMERTTPPSARPRRPQVHAREPLSLVHSTAGRDGLADGSTSAGRLPRVSSTTRLRSATGRLSHHPSADLLSRRQSRCHGVLSHRPIGASVRADAWSATDDLDQLQRKLSDYAPVQFRPQPGYRRAGGAGGD